jgi:hypothetical protein
MSCYKNVGNENMKEKVMASWLKGALAALVFVSGIGFAQEPPKAEEPKKEEPKKEEPKKEEPKKQEEGKKRGPLALPTSAELKEKCGLDDEQVKKADEVLASYKDKLAEAQKKFKESEDKKAAGKEAMTLRTEIVGKLREVCKDDEQKKKFDEATARPARKKDANK